MSEELPTLAEVIVVDDEKLYVPDAAAWAAIRKTGTFHGRPVGPKDLLWAFVDAWFGRPGLRLALGRLGKAFDVWRPYTITFVGTRPTRVHPLTVECPHCGWNGTGGTTAEEDLFMSFGRDFVRKFVAAQTVPPCPCPRCRQPMPDHIVWCDGNAVTPLNAD